MPAAPTPPGGSALALPVSEAGPAGSEPVVLLHGFPQDGSCWDRVLPALHGAGLRTLVPTQRGYSAAVRPAGRAAYRLRLLADDVVRLLDDRSLTSAHVVGHDWGGVVAWALAGWAPERVRSVTVCSTPHPAAMAAAARGGSQALRSWYVAAFQVPVLPEALLRPALERLLRRSGLPARDAERYAARMREPGALTAALNWYRALPLAAGGRDRVRRCRVPATFVWGRRDPALGRRAAELTEGFATGPYRFVELDAGHWLPETVPEEVARLVLERVRAAA